MTGMWLLWLGTGWAFYNDLDNDGSPDFIDCNDQDPTINPYAEELPNDGVDQDCDGLERCPRDGDSDGYGAEQGEYQLSSQLDCVGNGVAPSEDDCDDAAPEINPGAPELPADGVDSNCTGVEICYVDDDQDSYGSTDTRTSSDVTCTSAGVADNSADCDDTDAQIYPGATEVPDDGIDQDCNGSDLNHCHVDDDLDGYGTDTEVFLPYGCNVSGYSTQGGDCDDTDASRFPSATEIVADGVDQDCDGVELCYTDDDLDGVGDDRTLPGDLSCSDPGVSDRSDDCDDTDATISPLEVEAGCDGVDQDCDGLADDDPDEDSDGYGACTDDCDDSDGGVNPGVSEVLCNLVDDDCDPTTPDGVDNDTDGVSICAGDCNDSNPDISPLLEELLCSGIDEDCDPFTADAPDEDSDGVSVCDDDCDDTDPSINPGVPEVPCNGVNDDCNLTTPDGCVDSADTAALTETGGPTDTGTTTPIDTAPPQTRDTGTPAPTPTPTTTPTTPSTSPTSTDAKAVEASKPSYGFGCHTAPASPVWLGLLLLPLLAGRRP